MTALLCPHCRAFIDPAPYEDGARDSSEITCPQCGADLRLWHHRTGPDRQDHAPGRYWVEVT